ncbi:MAG: hypothetical protein V2A70_04780 [Candidatus Omnitrophota bacterium]
MVYFYADNLFQVVMRKLLSLFVVTAFILTSFISPSYAQVVFNLPQPGQMIGLSGVFSPVVLKGVSIHPEDPLLFDFIVDNGQSGLNGQALLDETTKLAKYFLAGVAVPENELWVNLSPKENDRIMADNLSHTDVGKELLAQDYILKQITSSLMYPENDLGRKFWDEIYSRAYSKFGSTDVPVDTFNKVWIAPSEATVYQNGNNAFVAGSHLKVMLESDYAAANGVAAGKGPAQGPARTLAGEMAKDVVREIIIPVLEKEVNEGKNFAALRQVFQSLILAGWYKNALKTSLLNQVYANTNKVEGITIEEQNAREKVYAQYMEAYRKGVFNYIKDDAVGARHGVPSMNDERQPRKYFSGGANFDYAMTPVIKTGLDAAQDVKFDGGVSSIQMRFQALADEAQISAKIKLTPAVTQIAASLMKYGPKHDPEGFGHVADGNFVGDPNSRSPRYGSTITSALASINKFVQRHYGTDPSSFTGDVTISVLGIGGQTTCVVQAKDLVVKHSNRVLDVQDSLGIDYQKKQDMWVLSFRKALSGAGYAQESFLKKSLQERTIILKDLPIRLLDVIGSKSGKTDETMIEFQNELRTKIYVWARLLFGDEDGIRLAETLVNNIWNINNPTELAAQTLAKLNVNKEQVEVLRIVFSHMIFVTGAWDTLKQSGSLLDRMIKEGFLGELYQDPQDQVVEIEMLGNLGGRFQGISPNSLAINALLGLDVKAMLEAGFAESKKDQGTSGYATQRLAKAVVEGGLHHMIIGIPDRRFLSLAEAQGQTVPESTGKGRQLGYNLGLQTFIYGPDRINQALQFNDSPKFYFIIDVKGQTPMALDPQIEANNIVYRYEMDGVNEEELARIMQFVEDFTTRLGVYYLAHVLSDAKKRGMGVGLDLNDENVMRQIMNGPDSDSNDKDALVALNKLFNDITPFRQPGVEMAKKLVVKGGGANIFNDQGKKDVHGLPVRDKKQRYDFYRQQEKLIDYGPFMVPEKTGLRNSKGEYVTGVDAFALIAEQVATLKGPLYDELTDFQKNMVAVIQDAHAKGKPANIMIYEDRNEQTEALKALLEAFGADRVDFGPAEQHKSRQLTVQGADVGVEIIIQSIRSFKIANQLEKPLVADGAVADYLHGLTPSEVRNLYASIYADVFRQQDVQTETVTILVPDLTDSIYRKNFEYLMKGVLTAQADSEQGDTRAELLKIVRLSIDYPRIVRARNHWTMPLVDGNYTMEAVFDPVTYKSTVFLVPARGSDAVKKAALYSREFSFDFNEYTPDDIKNKLEKEMASDAAQVMVEPYTSVNKGWIVYGPRVTGNKNAFGTLFIQKLRKGGKKGFYLGSIGQKPLVIVQASESQAETILKSLSADDEIVQVIVSAEAFAAGNIVNYIESQIKKIDLAMGQDVASDVAPMPAKELLTFIRQEVTNDQMYGPHQRGVVFNVLANDAVRISFDYEYSKASQVTVVKDGKTVFETSIPGHILSLPWIVIKSIIENMIKVEIAVTHLEPIIPGDKTHRPVKFGTSGDRGLFTLDFTPNHKNRIVNGIALYASNVTPGKTMYVGYDPRQDNKEAVKDAARILVANGLKVRLVAEEPTPVPVLAYLTNSDSNAAGFVAFTASHSPYTDGGVKFSPPHGGAAPGDVTDKITVLANGTDAMLMVNDYEQAKVAGVIEEIPVQEAVQMYVSGYIIPGLKSMGAWQSIVDYIKNTPDFRLVLDPMQGSAVQYFQALYGSLAKDAGRNFFTMINDNNNDPEFKDVNKEPNPTLDDSRAKLMAEVKKGSGRWMGSSADADADRFGNIDLNGEFMSANDMIALIGYFLKKEIGLQGGFAKTVATSNFVNAVANHLESELDEFAVGFKNVVASSFAGKKYVVGGEESSHVMVGPFQNSWDDGIVVGVMGLWMLAKTGKSLTEYKTEIQKAIGQKFLIKTMTIRGDDDSIKKPVLDIIAQTKQEQSSGVKDEELTVVRNIEQITGEKVLEVITLDGVKLVLPSGWILLRPSGTEPAIKFYVEVAAPSEADENQMQVTFDFLNKSGRELMFGKTDQAMVVDAGVADEDGAVSIDNAASYGGIDLGNGDYLKVIAKDALGMPQFDPAQMLQLKADLKGFVPVPVGMPQPVNLRPLLGLVPLDESIKLSHHDALPGGYFARRTDVVADDVLI